MSSRAIAATALGLWLVVAGIVATMLLYIYDCSDKTSLYDLACNDGHDGVIQPTGFGTAAIVGILVGALAAVTFVACALAVRCVARRLAARFPSDTIRV